MHLVFFMKTSDQEQVYIHVFQVTFQYSLWDKFKVVSDLAPHSVNNLSRLLSHLFATRAVSLAILKVLLVFQHFLPKIRLVSQPKIELARACSSYMLL